MPAPPQEIAESKLYTSDDGTVGMPQPNLYRCLIDAGKYFKAGRTKVTTQKSSIIPACVAMSPIFIPIEHEAPVEGGLSARSASRPPVDASSPIVPSSTTGA